MRALVPKQAQGSPGVPYHQRLQWTNLGVTQFACANCAPPGVGQLSATLGSATQAGQQAWALTLPLSLATSQCVAAHASAGVGMGHKGFRIRSLRFMPWRWPPGASARCLRP